MDHGGKRKGAGRPKGKGQFGEATKPLRLPVSMISSVIRFVSNKGYKLPLYGSKIQAGAPSSADDYVDEQIDLNEFLIKDPATTFLVRATGVSMIDAGIHENDILIVDKGIKPAHGKIAIVSLDGLLTVKRLHFKESQLFLLPENKDFEPIEVKETSDMQILGIVTNVIHSVHF
jgi:DNA polymerase V